MKSRMLVMGWMLLVSLSASAQQGARDWDRLAGRDITAKIASAFSESGGTAGHPRSSAVVDLPAGMNYIASTPLVLPNAASAPYIANPVLDCHGSTITLQGAGDKLVILGENGYKTGAIQNCTLVISDPAGLAKFYSRIDFLLQHVDLMIANHEGLQWINDTAHGGPGYFEENKLMDVQVRVRGGGCAMTWKQDHSIAGRADIGSFFYNFMEGVHADLEGNASLLCLKHNPDGQPAVVGFGSTISAHINMGGGGNAIFDVEDGAVLTRGVVNLEGEATVAGKMPDADVRVHGHGSFSNFGSATATGASHEYLQGAATEQVQFSGGPQPMGNDLFAGFGFATMNTEPGGAGHPGRLSKSFQWANGQAMALARFDPCPIVNTTWQVGWRQTSNEYPNVEIAGKSGNAFTNSIYADDCGNVGIGPGFGKNAAKPAHTLDVAGSFSATRMNAKLYTPPSSTAPCSPGDFADDANYHYVCVAANHWKRVALAAF